MEFRFHGWHCVVLSVVAFSSGAALNSLLFSTTPVLAAQAPSGSATYGALKTFGDVIERIHADYVDPIDDKALIENAINGMLTRLDPHSSYMGVKAYKDMQ